MTPFGRRWLGGLLTVLVVGNLLCAPATSFASMSDVTVSPVVIDGKGKLREILRFTVTLENTSKHLVTIYPWVTDVSAASGSTGVSDLGGSQEKPLSESLARWIEVTRGSIDLLPGEKKEVPLTVQINLNAKPGVYHAQVHFSAGADRASAEMNTAETEDVTVNIEVLEDINERLQLATFSPIKNIFSNKTAAFQYRLENIGNRGEVPRGKVRIFDRDGREVAVLDANEAGSRLEPEASAMLSSVWAAGGSFGRYKAMLDLEYGSRGTIQDTVFFWMIPWGKLLSMFLTLVLVCVIIAVVIHSRVTADRDTLRFAEVADRPHTSRMRSFWSSLWSDDEEDEEEIVDEADEPVRRTVVNEMRELTAPRPVHSRLAPREYDAVASTRLGAAPHHDEVPSAAHRVTLGKREKPTPPPHHVVNLRK